MWTSLDFPKIGLRRPFLLHKTRLTIGCLSCRHESGPLDSQHCGAIVTPSKLKVPALSGDIGWSPLMPLTCQSAGHWDSDCQGTAFYAESAAKSPRIFSKKCKVSLRKIFSVVATQIPDLVFIVEVCADVLMLYGLVSHASWGMLGHVLPLLWAIQLTCSLSCNTTLQVHLRSSWSEVPM